MHYVWSDVSHVSQFKGTHSWFHVAKYPRLTICLKLPFGCMMQWNYWGIGHGKGPHDGVGACLKQAMKKEQFKFRGENLQNVHDC
jgi:hypothetical protein